MLTVMSLDSLLFLNFDFLFLIIKDFTCPVFKTHFSFFHYLFIILSLKILIYTLESCRFTFSLTEYINRNSDKGNIVLSLIKNL